MTTTPYGLARRSVGVGSLWLFGVSASAPMTVLAGGVVTTYAATGVVGVPLSFIVLMVALLLFSVGFVALSRDVPHAATFAAFLALGLGRAAGVAGAAVALLAYNAIQISLYGLLGATSASLLGGPWWAWALAGWFVVAVLGVLHVHLNARVIGVVLIAELAVIVAFDITGFTHPADAGSLLAPLSPDRFLVDGIGGVMALGVAAFIGYESITAFREETREPGAVARAVFGILWFLGLFYAISSWALAVVVGPDRIIDTARDPEAGLPFSILAIHLGSMFANLGLTLLVLSIIGAMISFHNVVARYLFALGREGVLPSGLGVTVGHKGGVPVGGSIVQSLLAAVSIVVFALAGADPIAVMFTWLSTLAAVGVMALMIAASLAVISFYRSQQDRPEIWVRLIAPAAGAVCLAVVLAITLVNVGSTIGDPSGLAAWLLPGVLAGAAALGAAWAGWLRRRRPGAWDAIGRGQPQPLAVLDRALSGYEL